VSSLANALVAKVEQALSASRSNLNFGIDVVAAQCQCGTLGDLTSDLEFGAKQKAELSPGLSDLQSRAEARPTAR